MIAHEKPTKESKKQACMKLVANEDDRTAAMNMMWPTSQMRPRLENLACDSPNDDELRRRENITRNRRFAAKATMAKPRSARVPIREASARSCGIPCVRDAEMPGILEVISTKVQSGRKK